MGGRWRKSSESVWNRKGAKGGPGGGAGAAFKYDERMSGGGRAVGNSGEVK